MNTKHGLVAATWVLGSSLLLNSGSIAEAQQASAPDEYFAPQRTPAKPAPGLLPSFLRTPSQSSSESAARPIPASPAPDASSKLNGRTSAPMVRPSNRSVQATMYQQPNTPVQPANQNNAAPSPVQQQLEELYRRDGRQMPPMTLQQAPNTQSATGQNQLKRSQSGTVAPAGQNTPSNVVPPKSSTRSSILSKLNPFKSRQAPAPVPQHPSQPIQNQNGMAGRLPNGQPFGPAKPGAATNQLNKIAPNQFNSANAARLQPAPFQPAPIAPAAPPAQIEVNTQATAAAAGSELSKNLPPIPGDPDYIGAQEQSDATQVSSKPAGSVDDALENAFSDMPEEAVDAKTAALKEEPKATAEPNPFSGLSLDDETPSKATGSSTKLTVGAKKPEDDISLDAEKETTADANLDDIPLPIEPEDAIAADEKMPEPKDEVATTQASAEEIETKVKLIKERGELRGLKGFCAVALRDARDLKNALPEHTSTYKGRTYYFSSDEAKAAFEKQPAQYAPISGGNDVVLLKEKVTKEGSLDHAVWFKDRLYLFTSQKTLEQFVATPSGFVISE